MKVKLRNIAEVVPFFDVYQQLLDQQEKDEDKSYSFEELATAFNTSENETISLIQQLEELWFIYVYLDGQDFYKGSFWRFRSYQNMGLEYDKEYLVLSVTDKYIVTFTHSPSGPAFYRKILFEVTDPDQTGWVVSSTGTLQCPVELDYPCLWDRYSDRKPEAVEIYHRYLEKIGITPPVLPPPRKPRPPGFDEKLKELANGRTVIPKKEYQELLKSFNLERNDGRKSL